MELLAHVFIRQTFNDVLDTVAITGEGKTHSIIPSQSFQRKINIIK